MTKVKFILVKRINMLDWKREERMTKLYIFKEAWRTNTKRLEDLDEMK